VCAAQIPKKKLEGLLKGPISHRPPPRQQASPQAQSSSDQSSRPFVEGSDGVVYYGEWGTRDHMAIYNKHPQLREQAAQSDGPLRQGVKDASGQLDYGVGMVSEQVWAMELDKKADAQKAAAAARLMKIQQQRDAKGRDLK
jgi:hypothetical protein